MRFLALLFFIGCSTIQDDYSQQNTIQQKQSNWDKTWIQNGCSIFKLDGKTLKFPGSHCLFMNDGSVISANEKSMRRIAKDHKVLWQIHGHFHHQVNFSIDKSKILTISSEITNDDKKVREDVFLILSLDGEVLHQRKISSILKEKNLKPFTDWTNKTDLTKIGAKAEISHFNSIYEVPKNVYSSKLEWLKEGNVIINGVDHGIFILTPDLTKVLYHTVYPFSRENSIHDVQVNEFGEFLVFNNYTNSESHSSAIQKYNPVSKKITWQFNSEPKEMFFSAACGGVQEFSDIIFFSHFTLGSYVYSKSKRTVIAYFPGTNGDVVGIAPTQQHKLLDIKDISEFLNSAYGK